MVSSHYKSLMSYTKGNFAGLCRGNKAVSKEREFSSAAQVPQSVSRSDEAGRQPVFAAQILDTESSLDDDFALI